MPPSFDCNICLDSPSEPVITFCGHLYCWPCLYRWLSSGHDQCPVCKAGVTRETIVPLYGRGNDRQSAAGAAGGGGGGAASAGAAASSGATADAETDAETRSRGAGTVPRRPAAPRPPTANGAAQDGGGVTFTAGFGLFPSLFGLQFQTHGVNHPRRAGPLTPEEERQQLISHTLMTLGVMIFLALLFI